MKMNLTVTMLLLGSLCGMAAPAEKFTAHKLFSDHMVLQREKPVKIFGSATPGYSVAVSFASLQKTAEADAAGNWSVEFPAIEAGTGYGIEISGADPKNKLTFSDVAIGEVWLCSGQSNMEMPVWSPSPFWRAANADKEVEEADWPEIREFHVPRFLSPGKERKDVTDGTWKVCTSGNAKTFSAFAYFFARQLHKDMKVPVGIIKSAWGGTGIMAWMPQEAFEASGNADALLKIQDDAKKLKDADIQDTVKEFMAKFTPWLGRFNAATAEAQKAAESWKNLDFDDSSWEPLKPLQAEAGKEPKVIWLRNTVEGIPEAYAKGGINVSIPTFTGTSEVYLNGKPIGKTELLKPLGSIHKTYNFEIPEGVAAPGRNVLSIRLCDYGTGTTKFSDSGYSRLGKGGSGRPFNPNNWKMKTEYVADSSKIGLCPDPYDSAAASAGYPGTLFNGMIAPLVNYPVRGVLWYQGESDAYFAGKYYARQREQIKAWRARWGNPEMPFIITQLAGHRSHRPGDRLPDDFWRSAPADSQDLREWKILREVQGELGKLSNVGLVTAIDVGDHSDVHPRDKQTIGFRAAKEAERLAYGRDIVSRGPTYRSMMVEGGKIRILFDNAGRGLSTNDGEAPHAFAIAGKEGAFVWAETAIDGDTVLVWSPQIAAPARVLYAWVSFRPDLNLRNKEGFPAFPFRTDATEIK